jgi:PPK2 family polyphosphate:nucleotide phosphotransferase
MTNMEGSIMEKYRVKPGQTVHLDKIDPTETLEYVGDKDDTLKDTRKLIERLEALQELLYAEHRHRLLVVLQAMDTGGKDGVIRRVFEGVNPQGVRVANFKTPTPEELDHDYLWRVHKHTPARGEIVIFNRSHYEDVLVVRVHHLVPEEVWQRRYEHINHFERLLVDEGTTILKFFLHISKEEQKERLQARLDDPTKHWKFNPRDLEERQRWDEYMTAYEDVLNRTSTDYAPWYVIPADKKWYRDYCIARILVKTLEDFNMQYPRLEQDPKSIVIV